MTDTITTTQLLDFLVKADKVSTYLNVTKRQWQGNGLYEIAIHTDWDDNDNFYTATTSITEDGHSTWKNSDYEFFTMDSMLDKLVEKEEERRIKRQKREELLSRLTDEEKELLYLES